MLESKRHIRGLKLRVNVSIETFTLSAGHLDQLPFGSISVNVFGRSWHHLKACDRFLNCDNSTVFATITRLMYFIYNQPLQAKME
jgi:hypothetical protein